jgi:hypothetical protein
MAKEKVWDHYSLGTSNRLCYVERYAKLLSEQLDRENALTVVVDFVYHLDEQSEHNLSNRLKAELRSIRLVAGDATISIGNPSTALGSSSSQLLPQKPISAFL